VVKAIVLGVLAATGVAHADGADRGFWLGSVDDADHLELTLTTNEYRCDGCTSTSWISLALADLAGQHQLADGLTVFGQLSVVRQGAVEVPIGYSSDVEWFAGPATLGLRQRLRSPTPALTWAVAPSVTIPRNSPEAARLLRPDETFYPSVLGTLRVALEARWRPGRWWLAGSLAGAIETPEGLDYALTARAIGAVGVTLSDEVAAVVEGALTLIREVDDCGRCRDVGALRRPFVGAGLRGAWRHVTLAGHVGYQLDDDERLTLHTPVAVDFVIGATW
jgi:hypothetical protein